MRSASRSSSLSAAVVAAAAVAAGCGSQERVIPYRANLPYEAGPPERRNVPPIPRGARFCGPPEARLRPSGSQSVNSLTTLHYFTVRNRGRRTCVLRGRPAVQVLATGGLPLTIRAAASFVEGYPDSGPGWGLKPGQTASLTLVFVEGECTPSVRRRLVRVRLLLPGGGSGRLFQTGACPPGGGISLTPFLPPDLPEPKLRPWPLEAELDLPDRARAGSTLRFRVRLTNASERPFRFPYCPGAGARLGNAGTYETLNCRPAGALAPGETVVFEQRTRVSPHFRPRRRVLEWFIPAIDAARQIDATAPIEIVRSGR